MFYNGLFSRPAGLIYSDFDDGYSELVPILGDGGRLERMLIADGGHLVRPFSIPSHWLRVVGVDFGATLHNAQVWAAEEPTTGNYYVYREIAQVAKTGPEQAKEAAEYQEPVKAALGGAPSEDDARLEWGQSGFPIIRPLIHEVEPGIDRVVGLFRQKRLFVFDTLTGLRSELGTYSRELDDAGEPTAKIKDKDKFHRLDALRYLASFIPLERPVIKPAEQYPPATRHPADILKRRRMNQPRETEEYGVEEYY
jgi:hypothetical protein